MVVLDAFTELSADEQADALRYALRSDDWIHAAGGAESPFLSRSGVRMLYCFQPSTGQHAYLNCDKDTLMSQPEAVAAMDDTFVQEPKTSCVCILQERNTIETASSMIAQQSIPAPTDKHLHGNMPSSQQQFDRLAGFAALSHWILLFCSLYLWMLWFTTQRCPPNNTSQVTLQTVASS